MCAVSHLEVVPLMGNSLRLPPDREVTPQLSAYFTQSAIKMRETCSSARVSHCAGELTLKPHFKLHNDSSAPGVKQSLITTAKSPSLRFRWEKGNEPPIIGCGRAGARCPLKVAWSCAGPCTGKRLARVVSRAAAGMSSAEECFPIGNNSPDGADYYKLAAKFLKDSLPLFLSLHFRGGH